jgi:hypothetical protein
MRLWIISLGVMSVAAAAAFAILNRPFSNLSDHAGVQVTFSVNGDRQLPTTAKDSPLLRNSPAPIPSTEEPTWLTEALKDPNPRVRLQALEAWANNPGDDLNPFTEAMVDPDERVRARAQELLEEALARH